MPAGDYTGWTYPNTGYKYLVSGITVQPMKDPVGTIHYIEPIYTTASNTSIPFGTAATATVSGFIISPFVGTSFTLPTIKKKPKQRWLFDWLPEPSKSEWSREALGVC